MRSFAVSQHHPEAVEVDGEHAVLVRDKSSGQVHLYETKGGSMKYECPICLYIYYIT